LQAAEQAEEDPRRWRRHVHAATGLARESLTEARRSVRALRPERLETGRETERLSDALSGVARRWSAVHGVVANVITTGVPRPLPGDAEFTLLRTAQEALANVAKHARAGRVGLTLSYLDHEVALDVRDDGEGFDPGSGMGDGNGRGGGFGLVAMRQRIEDLAGTLRVESEPGGGTAIAARVPAGGAAPASSGGSVRVSGDAPIRLLIADDHPVVRDGLSGMFASDPGFEVLGEAGDGAETVRLAAVLRPDVILMDLRRPGMDGVAAITELARQGSAARVLVLSTYDTDAYVLPAVEAGATGYLLKDAPRSELYRAVRAAARGEAVLSPPVATRVLRAAREPDEPPLSARELEVLELVARGSTNREAAKRLFISEATVKTHLIHIYAKLGVPDRASAVATAYDRGLLQPRSR
jgi:DNA-binding NarL/FixJ family response regulator/two-component sensor histidine kinase